MTTYTDSAMTMQSGEEILDQGCNVSLQVESATTMCEEVEGGVGVRASSNNGSIRFDSYTNDKEKCNIVKKPLHYRFIKRSFDIVFSLAVITIALIPMVILSVFIAIDTKAFPIYTQERVGHKGTFRFYKLRSMVKDSNDIEKHFNPEQLEQWHKEHKVDNDPRITKLGAFLRHTSLDEIPQFFNVVLGSMSVIGPRCITADELKWFGDEIDLLLSVPQGITGAWQVGERNDATFENGMRQASELDYCANASLKIDAKIFFATFATMFIRRTGK